MIKKYFTAWHRAAAGMLAATTVLLSGTSHAQTTVTTIGGFDAGFKNGDTLHVALFHTPSGLAVDTLGNNIYVADKDNNAMRILELGPDITLSFTNALSKPVGVVLDANNDLYVLNFGTGKNGKIVEFTP